MSDTPPSLPSAIEPSTICFELGMWQIEFAFISVTKAILFSRRNLLSLQSKTDISEADELLWYNEYIIPF